MTELKKGMSLEEFNNGYFYAIDLKAFAKELGIKVGCLKKNELELHIRSILGGKKQPVLPKSIPNKKNNSARDQLNKVNVINNYVGDKTTKDFLLQQVKTRFNYNKSKSGQWYWLNSWRKEQIGNGNTITYADLVEHLYKLMSHEGRLPQIPSARMNNFITDFLADPSNEDATRKKAMQQWEYLKKINIPKTYQDYKRYISEKKRLRKN